LTTPYTRRFRIIWKDGGSTDVEVDDGAQRLYRGESVFEIAAILACLNDDAHAQRTNIKYVREV